MSFDTDAHRFLLGLFSILKLFKVFNGDRRDMVLVSLSTAKLLIEDVKSEGTLPSRQYIRESVNFSSVSVDLFNMDKSIGVAVSTDRLNKYSLNGSVKDFVRSVISCEILKFGTKSAPHRVVFRSSSMKFGRSWLIMKRVVSERSGLTSVTEIERASNGAFVRGMDLFDEWFDLKM